MQPRRRGSTRCRVHGGNLPQVLAKAERETATEGTIAAARKYGVPREIDPLDSLTEELARTQGHVDWLAGRIAENPDPHWLTVYQQERAHLVRLSHQMVTANIAERRVVMAEQTANRLETAVEWALRELGADPSSPRVRRTLGRHLRLVGIVPPADSDAGDAGPDDADVIDAELVDDAPPVASGDAPRPVQF